MIDVKRNFIFVHIPRTGGTSITQTLNTHNEFEWYHKHMPSFHLKKKLSSFDGYYKFAVVRNPFDWQYSVFSFVMSKTKRLRTENPSFKEWLLDEKWHQWSTTPWAETMKYVKPFPPIQLRNFSYWIDINGKNATDFLCRFERLSQDFNKVRSIIGTDIPKLVHVNKSVRKRDYKSEYDKEMIDFIEKHHEEDLTRFDYGY